MQTLTLALLATAPGCQRSSPAEEPFSAEKSPRTIYALGHLEPATGVIDIMATPGDRIKKLIDVVEGKIAPESGVLGLMSSYDMGKAQLTALLKKRALSLQKHAQQMQLAEAQLAQAIASKAQVQAKLTELALQRGRLDALRVARDLAEGEYLRLEKLRVSDPDLVTEHQLEKQKNRMDLTNEDFKIARDTHTSATASTKLAVSAAEANVAVAEIAKRQVAKNFEKLVVDQEIEVAREVLKRSILVAPYESPSALRGLLLTDENDDPLETTEDPVDDEKPQYTVLKVHLHRGEVVTRGPILQLGDLRKMVCIAEVHESDAKELWIGQSVTIRSPAFSGRFADGPLEPKSKKRSGGIQGHVVRIGRMVVAPGLSNRNPLAPVDRSVVDVRIEIENGASEEAQTLPAAANAKSHLNESELKDTAITQASKHVGLQVTVEFEPQKAESGKPAA